MANLINEQQERAKLSYEVQVYREQLRLLEREIERMNLATVDLGNALRTIENIKNDEIMVPVGGGSYIRADVKNTRVMVSIGADYVEDMESPKAVAELKKRMESTRKAFEKLNEQFSMIAKKLQDANLKMGSFTNNAQNEKGEGDNEAYF